MPAVRLNDVELYYEEHGGGEPVLLVPPSWWPCDTWKVVVLPVLGKRYRTILFDPRGTGRSSRPPQGYTVGQFGRDSIALLAHLGISRCHAVGYALGGQIAQAMAVECPDLIATLTMAAAGPGNKLARGGLDKARKDLDREIGETGFERFIRSHVDNDTTAFSPSFYQEHREVARALAQALWERQGSAEQFRYHHDARWTWETLAYAGQLQAPTLIIVGGDDTVRRGNSTPLATARRLAELASGSELAVIPGVKHMVFWDGTRAISMLLDFLARHPIAPGC